MLKAPEQATAEDVLALSVSWESNNSQNMKNRSPSTEDDQLMSSAAKHNQCTGKLCGNSSVPPVNENRL